MKPISQRRFEALAAYARAAATRYFAEELAWYEHADERVLGLLIKDRADSDFGGAVFARDKRLRYRCVDMTMFNDRRRIAEIELRRAMERAAAQPDEDYHQGDERGAPVDFFAASVPDHSLNPNFKHLRDLEQYSAARGIINPMMRWYDDVDGNFVEQFQTSGFDARIWELYLFAAFREMGFDIDRTHSAPDFGCIDAAADLAFYVEATTVNPSVDDAGKIVPPPKPKTQAELEAYLKDYMPIKFGSALYSKLRRKYWEKEHVCGHPFVIAVQDFSSPASMTRTRSAFESYIVGYRHEWERDETGRLKILPKRIKAHKWNGKEIPSGFFCQPDAENVSAVLFSNSGTISKFNRMGLLAGFGSGRLRLTRMGTVVNHDPDATSPLEFKRNVNDPIYSEIWSEGLDVWHNPRAKVPLAQDAFPFAAHHRLLEDGQVMSTTPEWHPLGSYTLHDLKGGESAPT